MIVLLTVCTHVCVPGVFVLWLMNIVNHAGSCMHESHDLLSLLSYYNSRQLAWLGKMRNIIIRFNKIQMAACHFLHEICFIDRKDEEQYNK